MQAAGRNPGMRCPIPPGLRDAIVQALEKTRYNKTAAAKRLGITFRALRYRLKKLGLE